MSIIAPSGEVGGTGSGGGGKPPTQIPLGEQKPRPAQSKPEPGPEEVGQHCTPSNPQMLHVPSKQPEPKLQNGSSYPGCCEAEAQHASPSPPQSSSTGRQTLSVGSHCVGKVGRPPNVLVPHWPSSQHGSSREPHVVQIPDEQVSLRESHPVGGSRESLQHGRPRKPHTLTQTLSALQPIGMIPSVSQMPPSQQGCANPPQPMQMFKSSEQELKSSHWAPISQHRAPGRPHGPEVSACGGHHCHGSHSPGRTIADQVEVWLTQEAPELQIIRRFHFKWHLAAT